MCVSVRAVCVARMLLSDNSCLPSNYPVSVHNIRPGFTNFCL